MITKAIWTSHPERYAYIQNESRQLVLYPVLIKLIEEFSPSSVIDYGCGDGSLLKLIRKPDVLSAYDASRKARTLALQNLREHPVKMYSSKRDIPPERYDCVILSLVLMTIKTRRAMRELLKTVHRIKRPRGKVLIAVTHPCFRQYAFSTFHTEYLKSGEFSYFEDGKAFSVYLKDSVKKSELSFVDYHWSLSTTFNSIADAGLNVFRTIEVKDGPNSVRQHNTKFPPYLIFACI